MSKDVEKISRRALEDLDKANVLEPNNAFTLTNRGKIKGMLENKQGALEDLDKYQRTIELLPFNSSIQSFTYNELNFGTR
jgi:regulator of sirC expression with transglutaminase-like and TPR domain